MEAWVLHAEIQRQAERAARPLRHEEVQWMDEASACVQLEEPDPRVRKRVERRLGHPVEVRLDCDVAWYPLGRGYVVMTVSQPADALPAALEEASPAFHELMTPADPKSPLRLCMPRLAVAEPMALAEAWRAQGLGILAVYEVGGCRR